MGYPGQGDVPKRVVGEPVEKSPNDKLEYRLLTFESGFEALLVSSSDAKKNKAAAAVAVGVGSFMDPQGRCEGLAHYLEHMLFMGSTKYPGEDEMEEFLSKNGGYSNAYTEAAHTCYYFEVNKTELHKALDMFAQFFVAPLFKIDAAEREINAIESEFRLTQNSDGSRVEQLFASFARPGHPFRTFGWGNLKSLRDATAAAGVDLNGELRAFYDLHYRAPRMRLCVYGVEPLDQLEEVVRASFTGLMAAKPGEAPEGPQEAALARFGPPFEKKSLPKVLRVRPVKDVHKLALAWQLAPTQHLYKTQPCNYIRHLIGHEGAGSLLSFLKRHGLATSLSAGVSDDSFQSNSMCTIFTVEISLTVAGLEKWPDVVHATFLYLDMIRSEKPQEWVHDELVKVANMDWRFLEESNPTDQAQGLACKMLPVYRIEQAHLLKWPWMATEFDPAGISALLEDMRAERLMIDVLSSAYGRSKGGQDKGGEEGDDDDDDGDDMEDGEEDDADADMEADGGEGEPPPAAKDPTFDPSSAAPPIVEPNFGTEHWVAPSAEVEILLSRWTSPAPSTGWLSGAREALRLPDRNEFLATDFDLRPDPTQREPQVPAMPPGGLRSKYGDFPPIPTPVPQQPRRLEEAAKLGMRVWHMPDSVFKTPRSEFWVKLASDQKPVDPMDARFQIMLVLLARVMSDTLNEMLYLASEATLHAIIKPESYGLDIMVGGFHHKLPLLLKAILSEVLSFADQATWEKRSSDAAFKARIDSQKESLIRAHRNAYMKPGDHCADMRRCLIMTNRQLATERASALEGVDLKQLAAFAMELIPVLKAEGLFSGNLTGADALELAKELPAKFWEGSSAALPPLPAHPDVRVVELPIGSPTIWIEDSPDTGNPNVAVEMFWQFDPINERTQGVAAQSRAHVTSDLLEALMSEPLFDVLRTKQQLGYIASCGLRLTLGVLGFSIWLVSSKVGAAEICKRTEAFLVEFRQQIVDMPAKDIEQHVCSLAARKLEPSRTLASLQANAWREIEDRRSVFERPLIEAVELATVGREDVLKVLDDYILPTARKRRLAIVAAVGGTAKTDVQSEIRALKSDYSGSTVVSSLSSFLRSAPRFECMM